MGKRKQWKRRAELSDWDVVRMPRVKPVPGWEVYFGKERVGAARGTEASEAKAGGATKETSRAA